jgi:hypothetical protein
MPARRSKGESRSQRPTSARSRANSLPPGRGRQSAKINEIGKALAAAGLRSLDEQAEAIGLSRSTTWTLLRAKHKGSGLSARIIAHMLSAPHLPLPVRAKILEYLAEKTAGLHGDTERELRRFVRRLALYRIVDK